MNIFKGKLIFTHAGIVQKSLARAKHEIPSLNRSALGCSEELKFSSTEHQSI